MGDLALLLGAGASGALGGAIIILLRMLGSTRKLLAEADQRYRAEVKDHENTQAQLDAERKIRREMEDKFEAELRGLRSQVAEQTRRIGHLEAEVARLNGPAS